MYNNSVTLVYTKNNVAVIPSLLPSAVDKNDYVLIRIDRTDPYYPMAKAISGTLLEHRYVMAKSLGRCLKSHELVHHKNGIRNDNRIQNLELCQSRAIHPPRQRLKDLIIHNMQDMNAEELREIYYACKLPDLIKMFEACKERDEWGCGFSTM